jgi:hypothetical protein
VTAPGTGATPGSLAGAVVTRLSPADVTCPSRAAFRLARLGGGSDFGYLGLPADGSHLVAQITVRFPPSTIVVSLCADPTGHLWYFSHDSQSADTGLVTPATLVPDGAGFSAHFDFAAPGGTVPAAYLVEADGVAVTSGVPPAAKTTLLGVVRVECVDRSALRLTWPALGAPVCAAADTLGWHPSLR